MDDKDLLAWAESEKARLEEKGRAGGKQYQAVLMWIGDAKRMAEVPPDWDWPTVAETEDARTWATRTLQADAVLYQFVRLRLPINFDDYY